MKDYRKSDLNQMLIKIRNCKQNYIHGILLENIQDTFYLLRKPYIMLSCLYSILLKVQNNFLRMFIPIFQTS